MVVPSEVWSALAPSVWTKESLIDSPLPITHSSAHLNAIPFAVTTDSVFSAPAFG